MSDEMMNHGHNAGEDIEYEHEDLGSRGIFAFMIGLVVSSVIIYVIIIGMYRFLDAYEKSQMVTASPLVAKPGTITRNYTQDEMDQAFQNNGAPMLETDERTQFRGFLLDQEDQLNSYGWVDQKAGIAHIPIERAIELTIPSITSICAEGCTKTGDLQGSEKGNISSGKTSAK
jgi:hypothetical protein